LSPAYVTVPLTSAAAMSAAIDAVESVLTQAGVVVIFTSKRGGLKINQSLAPSLRSIWSAGVRDGALGGAYFSN
jgi:hypothetical protein